MVEISAEVLKVIREAAAEQETSPGAFAGKILTDWVRQYDYEKNHPDNIYHYGHDINNMTGEVRIWIEKDEIWTEVIK